MEMFHGPVAQARRDLHREQMIRFAAELEWLNEPALIPPGAATDHSGNPFYSTAVWLTDSMSGWSETNRKDLSYAKTFNKHGLDTDGRVIVKRVIRDAAQEAFGPGIEAIGQILGAVPLVATREGVSVGDWFVIANKARTLGKQMSYDGTAVQALVRTYLSDLSLSGNDFNSQPLDDTKLMLDENSNLTSVTPIELILEAAREESRKYVSAADLSNACVALQANIDIGGHSVAMFDAVWDAFCNYAASSIYPTMDIKTKELKPVIGADANPRKTFRVISNLVLQGKFV